MQVERSNLILGALLGGTAVVLGALGSHAFFAAGADPKLINAWDVGVRYQAWHALALLALAPLERRVGGGALPWLFGIGVLGFSGSLYLLALEVLPDGLGVVTPIGGVVLIAGWLLLFGRALRMGAERA